MQISSRQGRLVLLAARLLPVVCFPIAVASDASLEVEEVFAELDRDGVYLVVLSACQKALGERTRGGEILSLTQAFSTPAARRVHA